MHVQNIVPLILNSWTMSIWMVPDNTSPALTVAIGSLKAMSSRWISRHMDVVPRDAPPPASGRLAITAAVADTHSSRVK